MSDAELVLRSLRATRTHIESSMDAAVMVWEEAKEEYPWFNRAEWLAEQRLALAKQNAAIARRIPLWGSWEYSWHYFYDGTPLDMRML
jgi:hypothetical protein